MNVDKKVLLVGAYGTGNLGDEALLTGLLEILTSNKKYDGSSIVVFSRDPSETMFFHGVLARRKNLFDIFTADEVIFGGGELFQDRGSMAIKYSIVGIIAKILRKRVIFYGVGLSSIKSRVGKLLTRLSFSIADDVSVRDLSSKNRFKDLGIHRKVSVVDDLSFYVQPISREQVLSLLEKEGIKVARTNVVIGITFQYIPKAHAQYKKLNEQIGEFFLSFVRHVLRKYKSAYVVFIPFSYHKDRMLDNDIIYGKRLEKRLGTDRFKVLHKLYRPEDVMGMFRIFDIVVSTRLHPLIFAFRNNVPGIGVDIFGKVVSFCSEHDLPLVKIDEPKHLYHLTDVIINQKLKK